MKIIDKIRVNGNWIGSYIEPGHAKIGGRNLLYCSHAEAVQFVGQVDAELTRKVNEGYYSNPANWPINRKTT